jgi:hypothetical protein
MKKGQELVEAPKVELSVFNKFEAELVEFEKVNELVTFDLDTFEGEEDCKKHVKNIGKLRIGVEKLRKSTKKEFVDGGNAVDKEAKVWQARIAAIDSVHSVPLKALENKRIKEVLDKVEAEKAEAKAIQDKKDTELDNFRRIAAEQEAAAEAIEDTKRILRDAAKRKEEFEAAALLAVEDAKLQAKQDAIDVAAKANQDQINAVAETKRQAEAVADALAKEITDKYEAEQAEQRKIDAGILARQQDVAHRKEINNKAVDALDALVTQNTELSIAIVTEIAKGNIPGIVMVY